VSDTPPDRDPQQPPTPPSSGSRTVREHWANYRGEIIIGSGVALVIALLVGVLFSGGGSSTSSPGITRSTLANDTPSTTTHGTSTSDDPTGTQTSSNGDAITIPAPAPVTWKTAYPPTRLRLHDGGCYNYGDPVKLTNAPAVGSEAVDLEAFDFTSCADHEHLAANFVNDASGAVLTPSGQTVTPQQCLDTIRTGGGEDQPQVSDGTKLCVKMGSTVALVVFHQVKVSPGVSTATAYGWTQG
jgi:hypothetical protein